jgi:hypothetical protein
MHPRREVALLHCEWNGEYELTLLLLSTISQDNCGSARFAFEAGNPQSPGGCLPYDPIAVIVVME